MNNQSFMWVKKAFFLLVSFFALFAMAGCSDDDDDNSGGSSSPFTMTADGMVQTWGGTSSGLNADKSKNYCLSSKFTNADAEIPSQARVVKVFEKAGTKSSDRSTVMEDFQLIIFDDESNDEFEKQWVCVVNSYGTFDNGFTKSRLNGNKYFYIKGTCSGGFDTETNLTLTVKKRWAYKLDKTKLLDSDGYMIRDGSNRIFDWYAIDDEEVSGGLSWNPPYSRDLNSRALNFSNCFESNGNGGIKVKDSCWAFLAGYEFGDHFRN